MIPNKFNESNFTLLAPKGMDNCEDLHTFFGGEKHISCWQMTAEERAQALLFGKVWLFLYGHPSPPAALMARNTVFIQDGETDKPAREIVENQIDRKVNSFLLLYESQHEMFSITQLKETLRAFAKDLLNLDGGV